MMGAHSIHAGTILWAAGVTPSPLARTLGIPVDQVGRIHVNEDLSVPNHPEVFVIGDLAAVSDRQGRLLPGLASVAVQEGQHAARTPYPADTIVEVTSLYSPEALIEIEAIAVCDNAAERG